MTGRRFSPGTPVSSTNKTDRHDITEIVLKVALKHNQTNKQQIYNLLNTLLPLHVYDGINHVQVFLFTQFSKSYFEIPEISTHQI